MKLIFSLYAPLSENSEQPAHHIAMLPTLPAILQIPLHRPPQARAGGWSESGIVELDLAHILQQPMKDPIRKKWVTKVSITEFLQNLAFQILPWS